MGKMGNGPYEDGNYHMGCQGAGGGAHHRAILLKNKYKIESIICLNLGLGLGWACRNHKDDIKFLFEENFNR